MPKFRLLKIEKPSDENDDDDRNNFPDIIVNAKDGTSASRKIARVLRSRLDVSDRHQNCRFMIENVENKSSFDGLYISDGGSACLQQKRLERSWTDTERRNRNLKQQRIHQFDDDDDQ